MDQCKFLHRMLWGYRRRLEQQNLFFEHLLKMAINRTAYQTKACEGFKLHTLQESLTKAQLAGQLQSLFSTPIMANQGSDAFALAVPGFAHPFEVAQFSNHQAFLAVDLRPVGRWDASQWEFVIRNQADYDLISARALLNHYWINESPEILRDVAPLALSLYTDFITKNVAKRFALDRREEADLSILVGWFYLSQFTNEKTLVEREAMRMVQTLARQLRLPADMVFAVIDRMGEAGEYRPIHSITEFCHLAQSATNSVRLQDLNIGILYQLLGGQWFGGQNPRELVAVALEHPPTWLAIVWTAANSRSFKTAGITQLFERTFSSQQQTQFKQAMANFMNGYRAQLQPASELGGNVAPSNNVAF